jgi:hypothetical protein
VDLPIYEKLQSEIAILDIDPLTVGVRYALVLVFVERYQLFSLPRSFLYELLAWTDPCAQLQSRRIVSAVFADIARDCIAQSFVHQKRGVTSSTAECAYRLFNQKIDDPVMVKVETVDSVPSDYLIRFCINNFGLSAWHQRQRTHPGRAGCEGIHVQVSVERLRKVSCLAGPGAFH